MATVELNQVDLNHKNKYLRILILIIICTGCMDHKKEIYFGFNENPYSTDSYDYDAYVNQVYQSAIYGTLLSGNSSNEIAPALAKSWRQSSDFKEWELDLNENLFFSNGDTIDCLSAKKSLQRISFLMKSKGSRDGFLEYLVNFEKMKNANDNVLGISCHGNTIRFVFQIPMKDFASKITFGLYSIVHPKSFDSESGVWFDKSNSISSFSYVSSRDINNEPISLVLRKDFNLKIGHDKKFEKIDIVITRYKNENSGKVLEKEMKKKNIKVYFSKTIKDYPNDLDEILGQKGFIEQPYIQTNKKINVVIGAVANSGKMGICLAQIFLDSKNKINSGYFKSETFPVFNLPLNHPINLAYEAATADIGDKNIIDPYHKKAYGITAINYNRDIENFKILKKIINKIISKKNKMHEYKSPTDMGINTVKSSIINEEKIKEAARKEIIKRHKKYIEKKEKREVIERMEKILKKIIP